MGLTTFAQEKQHIMDTTYLTISSPPPVDEIGLFLAIQIIVVFGAMGGAVDFLRRFRVRPAYLIDLKVIGSIDKDFSAIKRSGFNSVICYEEYRITVMQFISLLIIHSLTGSFGAFTVQLVLMSLGILPGQLTEDLLLFSGVCVISGVAVSSFLRPIRREI